MIGMVIIGPRRENEVGIHLPHLADDLFPDWQGREQLTVVIVQHDILDADAFAGFLGLGPPAIRQRAAAFGLMPGVTAVTDTKRTR
jgi:hypothetical protein